MGKVSSLILASASKQRRRILKDCGIVFIALKSGAAERTGKSGHVSGTVMGNARVKALRVAEMLKDGLILGADTMVYSGGLHMGKTSGQAEAMRLLAGYSGKRVDVYTGLHLIDKRSGRTASGWEVTEIRVKKLEKEEIEVYCRLLSAPGSAGGFSAEGPGGLVFDDIRGSYLNVLGMPVMKLSSLLENLGLSILSFMDL